MKKKWNYLKAAAPNKVISASAGDNNSVIGTSECAQNHASTTTGVSSDLATSLPNTRRSLPAKATSEISVFRTRRAGQLCADGIAAQLIGDLSTACHLYQSSLAVVPTAEAHTCLGWAYAMKGKTRRAIDECLLAVEIDPDFGNPYNDIGTYLLRLGDAHQNEAEEWFELAKDAPNYEPRHYPYLNLGRMHAARGDFLGAYREINTAIKLKPDEAMCWVALRQLKQQHEQQHK